ncbi:MAG: hypothetical protein IPL61_03255 [Myxococcales bacterium]|nr:hypothetical protein [Myxococcales bacterium]
MRTWGEAAHVGLRLVDGAATDRVTIATEYDLPDDGGCAVGGGGPAPIAALPRLLRGRRRRPATHA